MLHFQLRIKTYSIKRHSIFCFGAHEIHSSSRLARISLKFLSGQSEVQQKLISATLPKSLHQYNYRHLKIISQFFFLSVTLLAMMSENECGKERERERVRKTFIKTYAYSIFSRWENVICSLWKCRNKKRTSKHRRFQLLGSQKNFEIVK